MTSSSQDGKVGMGSINEKDAQLGTSDVHRSGCREALNSKTRPHALANDGSNLSGCVLGPLEHR
jgi:hypothetical protein